MRLVKGILGALALAGLAGCVIDSPRSPGGGTGGSTNVVQPTGIEGSWQNSEGLYNATFANASTVWTDTQTGNTLVTGSYQRVNQTDYEMTLTSQVSGRTMRSNCRLFTVNQLNCSREDGNQFSMVRLAS